MDTTKTMHSQEKNTKNGDISKRIEKVRLHLGISKSEFARITGVAQQTYLNYSKGRVPPSDFTAFLMSKYGVDGNWLLIGHGEMFSHSQSPKPEAPEPPAERIPVLAQIQAGPNGRFVADQPLYYLPRPAGVLEKPLYGFEVCGDSMLPIYKPGDVVFATPVKTPKSGEDHVVQIDWDGDQDELVLKRLHRTGLDKIVLKSLNKEEYPPYEVDRQHIKGLAQVVSLQWHKSVINAKIDVELEAEKSTKPKADKPEPDKSEPDKSEPDKSAKE